MKIVETTKTFEKDLKKMFKRGCDMDKFDDFLTILHNSSQFPAKYKVHKLSGEWVDHLDAHISPDWILIFRITDTTIHLERTGTHSDLFN